MPTVMSRPARKKNPPLTGEGWMDISLPLKEGMPQWPGDPPFALQRARSIGRGSEDNVSRISMSAHTGTHIDAPLHYIEGEAGIGEIPFDIVIGPCRVIGIKDRKCVRPEELRQYRLACGDRVLFRTRNSARALRAPGFTEDFVYLSTEAAALLAGTGVRMVGIDYLSVGGFREGGAQTHRALLKAGVWIVEGLDLSRVEPGYYDLICLPLSLPDAEGAPARAVLRPRAKD